MGTEFAEVLKAIFSFAAASAYPQRLQNLRQFLALKGVCV